MPDIMPNITFISQVRPFCLFFCILVTNVNLLTVFVVHDILGVVLIPKLMSFAGEKTVSVFGPCNLRHSRDWTGNGWVKLRGRPDIVTSNLSLSTLSSLKTKQDLCKSYIKKSNAAPIGAGIQSKHTDIYLGSSEKDKLIRKPEVVPDLLKDVLLSQLRWKSSRKRNQGRTYPLNQKYCDRQRKLSPSFLESDDSDSFVIPASLKVDHDDYKYQGDPSIFSSSVVPSLTNMVMCR